MDHNARDLIVLIWTATPCSPYAGKGQLVICCWYYPEINASTSNPSNLIPPISTRCSARASPRRQDPGFLSTPGDSRTALTRPANPITIGIPSSDDEEGNSSDFQADLNPENEPSPNPTPTKSQKSQKKAPSKKRKKKSGSQSLEDNKRRSAPAIKDFTAPTDVDVDQVTDDEGPKTEFRTAITDKVKNLLAYYKEPEFVPGEEHTGIKRNYPCKFCKGVYARGDNGNSNLYGHRDGYKKRKVCEGRHRAIKAGLDLPPTWKELNEPVQVSMKSGNTIKSFLSQSVFSVELLNVVLVIWILRHALPWLRFQDPTLRAAFKLCNPTGVLRSPKWAASTAKELFYSLYNVVINRIKNNSSMFSLAHDGWTTKGNRMAFIGVMINYIDDNWNYVTVHLTLKWVTWHHCGDLLARPVARNLIRHGLHKKMIGQTTDSGSSNGPMAREMARLFAKSDSPVHWSPAKSHVKCFCHKLALMVSHGLKTLNVSANATALRSAALKTPILRAERYGAMIRGHIATL